MITDGKVGASECTLVPRSLSLTNFFLSFFVCSILPFFLHCFALPRIFCLSCLLAWRSSVAIISAASSVVDGHKSFVSCSDTRLCLFWWQYTLSFAFYDDPHIFAFALLLRRLFSCTFKCTFTVDLAWRLYLWSMRREHVR